MKNQIKLKYLDKMIIINQHILMIIQFCHYHFQSEFFGHFNHLIFKNLFYLFHFSSNLARVIFYL